MERTRRKRNRDRSIESYIEKHPIPPNTDKIDGAEVWLLDNHNKRIKRICGNKKSGFPKGYVCEKNAGRGTKHVGYGKCEEHERRLQPEFMYNHWTKIKEKFEKDGKEIIPILDSGLKYASLLTKDMSDLSGEFELTIALLIGKLENKAGSSKEISRADLEDITMLLREMRNIKEAHHRIKKDTALDLRIITAFVDKIFTTIVAVAKTEDARKIMERINKEALVPIGASSGKEGTIMMERAKKSEDRRNADSLKHGRHEVEDIDFIDSIDSNKKEK